MDYVANQANPLIIILPMQSNHQIRLNKDAIESVVD